MHSWFEGLLFLGFYIFFCHHSMATYEREEVERVILAFYNGQNVVEANAWLTSFVASQVR